MYSARSSAAFARARQCSGSFRYDTDCSHLRDEDQLPGRPHRSKQNTSGTSAARRLCRRAGFRGLFSRMSVADTISLRCGKQRQNYPAVSWAALVRLFRKCCKRSSRALPPVRAMGDGSAYEQRFPY
jgi:hypothetical protein